MRRRARLLLEQALGKLKELEHELARKERPPEPPDLVSWLRLQAELLDIELELQVAGSPDHLAPSHTELLRLAGREAMLNVRRHAGTRRCRIQIDLSSCPFSLRARDWGSGADGSTGGQGLELLSNLGAWLGCEITVKSQPGLGTELAVLGPRCHLATSSTPASVEVVASS